MTAQISALNDRVPLLNEAAGVVGETTPYYLVKSALKAGSGVTVNANDATGQITLSASGGGGTSLPALSPGVLTSDGTNLSWANSSAAGGVLVARQVITTSGTYTPSTGVTVFDVEVRGPGGSGGGGETNVNGAAASGGGGEGGYTRKRFSVVSGATGTCVIGSGGSPVTAATNGNQGGTTTFAYNGATLTGNGGQGGISAATGGTGGLGGTASGGDINIQGSPGHGGTNAGFPAQSGNGGCSWPLGTPGRGGFINTATTATNGSNGAGGGGANGGYGAYANSGSGGNGTIVITEYK